MPDYGNNGVEVQLYAKWNIINYTITYVLNGGTNNASNPGTYTILDSVTLLDPTKTRTGYTCSFNEWSPTDTIIAGSTGHRTFTAS